MRASKRKSVSNDDCVRKVSRTLAESSIEDASNMVYLVFPFGSAEVDTAGDGLNELGSASMFKSVDAFGRDTNTGSKIYDGEEGMGLNSSHDDKAGSSKKFNSRTHFLTIDENDYKRLQPGEYLNDTLVDFFMQW
jgi:Ulp1 family protease